MKARTRIVLTLFALAAFVALSVYAGNPVPFATVSRPDGVAGYSGGLIVTESCTQNIDTVDFLGNVTVLTTIPGPSPTPTCLEKYVAVAPPESSPAGFTPGNIFVTQGVDIYKIVGATVTHFATIAGANIDHTSITFDTVGTFGNKMIVTTSDPQTSTNGGKVYKVDSSGTKTLIADLSGTTQTIEGPAVVPSGFGTHGGEIFVADESLGQVHAVNSSGTPTFDLVDWTGAEGVIVIPTSAHDYFVAAENLDKIYTNPSSEFTGLEGNVLVTSESGSGIVLVRFDSGSSTYVTDFGGFYGNVDGAGFEGSAFGVSTPSPTPREISGAHCE